MGDLEKYGFSIVSDEEGMDSAMYTAACSGSRTDCCTRTCSTNANFVENEEAWEQYLTVKGGQVQY